MGVTEEPNLSWGIREGLSEQAIFELRAKECKRRAELECSRRWVGCTEALGRKNIESEKVTRVSKAERKVCRRSWE